MGRRDEEEQAIFGQVVVAQSVAMPPLDMKIILDAIEIGKEDGDIATINVQHIQNLIDTITQLRQQVAELLTRLDVWEPKIHTKTGGTNYEG
jgi:Ni,Fe-hydrogenase maturation factor